MVRLLLALLALSLGVAPAAAGTEPIIAPRGDWVETVEPAAADAQASGDAVQTLLITSQSYYAADADETYLETVQRVQNPQGLQIASQIALPWQPEHSDLIVHKVQIVRNGSVIDLLANGQRFTVLRRENNLESAMLDGELTAVMQPDGLSVGDTLVIAYTVRTRAGALPLRGQKLLILPPGLQAERVFVRDVWSEGRKMQWRVSDAYGQARERRTRLGTELSVRRDKVRIPQPIESVPLRYALGAYYQVSEFKDWEEVSRFLFPFFDRAASLAPDSPLNQEISRIAASSADPMLRSIAALRLVQDQVRYFALMMGDGNYLPATAEQTWSRRYGDCKAKTTLLLAILRRLDIEAEPVLVSSAIGDPIAERLPQLLPFNHILVRARIGGRMYWLDGTRLGDRDLVDLATTVHEVGLPLRSAGATLETIPYLAPARPLTETTTIYDASAGLAGAVPMTSEVAMRGEMAAEARALIAQAGMEAVRQQLLAGMPASRGVTSVEIREDEPSGRLLLVYKGSSTLTWEQVPGASGSRFRFDNETISWTPDFERPADQDQTAPFSLSRPYFAADTQIVILPDGGRGFSLEGDKLDKTIAGSEIRRELRMENGRAIAHSSFRRVATEVDARAARESLPLLKEISADRAFIRAPISASLDVARAVRGRTTDTSTASSGARELVASGYNKLQIGSHAGALADFERAIADEPQWSLAHANRAVALIWLKRLDEAQASAEQALRLDAKEAIAHQAMAMLMLRRHRLTEALAAADAAVGLDADNHFTWGLRSEVHERLGRFDEALDDLQKVLQIEPGHALAGVRRAHLLERLGRTAEAAEAMRAAVQADPRNFVYALELGHLLRNAGDTAGAEAAFSQALEQFDLVVAELGGTSIEDPNIQAERMELLAETGRYAEALAIGDRALRRQFDNIRMLAARCLVRVYEGQEIERALKDCDQALRWEQENDRATAARAYGRLKAKQWAGAIADFSAMLNWDAEDAHALYGRGLARLASGDTEGGARDLDAARRLNSRVSVRYDRLGVPRPPEAVAQAAVASGSRAAQR